MFTSGIRSIKTEILTKVIIIMVFSMCASVAYNYFAGKQLAISNAAESIERVNSAVIYRSSNFLFEARNIAKHGASLLNEADLSSEFMLSIKNYMFSVLKSSSVVTSLNFGLESGFFLSVDKIATDSNTLEKTNIPYNAFFVLRFIAGGFEDSKLQEIYYTKDLVEIPFKPTKHSTSIKDFREFTWYSQSLKTQQPYFSNIHILHTNSIPGVTTSTPITNHQKKKLGVFSVDISVQELSTFINEMRPTDYSRSFIVDKDTKIIADSDMEEITERDKDNNIKIVTAKKLADPSLDMALNQHKAGIKNDNLPENVFNLVTAQKDFIVSVDSFPSALGLDWFIVSLTPSSVFTAEAFAIQRNSIYLAVLILLIAIIVVYFQAQNISEPIVHLAGEAKKIQSLDLDDVMFLNSNVTEIHELINTMQESQKNLINFSKYVPKGLVNQIIESRQEVEIGGSTKEVTLMFTDVANFTTVSEGLPPQDLMLHLSDYFDMLTHIIIANNGTVDKFIGDAIMTFWGAPLPNPNQTMDACRTALLCQQDLKNMNKFWKRIGKPPFVTRFGINFGNAVIGNVGSSERMNYTAIGDSVNLAARLEGINKMYGTNIIISDLAYARLNSNFIVRPLDVVAVRGKEESTKIFELIGIKGDEQLHAIPDAHVRFCEEFTIAFNLYLDRHWAKAKKAFESLNSLNQQELHFPDTLAPIYIERCANLIKNPPEKDWDGVIHLKEK